MPDVLVAGLALHGGLLRAIIACVSGALMTRSATREPLLMLLDHFRAGVALVPLLRGSVSGREVMLRLLLARAVNLGPSGALPRLSSLSARLRRLRSTPAALPLFGRFLAHTVLRVR